MKSFIFSRGLLLWFSFICICGGLREVSWLSELLNIQGVLMALWGAGCFGRAGQAIDMYFLLTRIGSNCLFFKWILQLLLMEKPQEPLASGRVNPCGAAIAGICWVALGSAPGWNKPTSVCKEWCLESSFLSVVWIPQPGSLMSGDKIRHKVFCNIHTSVIFLVWKCEEWWCYQAFLIRYSSDEIGKLATCSWETKGFSYSWKIHLISWFQKPEHRRKHRMFYSLVIKNYRV